MKSKINPQGYPQKTIIVTPIDTTPVATESIMHKMNSVLPKMDVLSTDTIEISVSLWDSIGRFLSDNIVVIATIGLVLLGLFLWFIYRWYTTVEDVSTPPPVDDVLDGITVTDTDAVATATGVTTTVLDVTPVTDAVADGTGSSTTVPPKEQMSHNTAPIIIPIMDDTLDDLYVSPLPFDPMSIFPNNTVNTYATEGTTEGTTEDEDEDIAHAVAYASRTMYGEDAYATDATEDDDDEDDEDDDAYTTKTEVTEVTEVIEKSEPSSATSIRSLFGAPPKIVATKCIHTLTKGERSGQQCGKDTASGRSYCYNHNRK